jgi:hypothetical protein
MSKVKLLKINSTEIFRTNKYKSKVNERHLILNEKYLKNPELAFISDSSEVVGKMLNDPFKTLVLVNENMKVSFKVGVHKSEGGNHDFPNPGDILCAALASCFESTLRLVSNKLGVVINRDKNKSKC